MKVIKFLIRWILVFILVALFIPKSGAAHLFGFQVFLDYGFHPGTILGYFAAMLFDPIIVIVSTVVTTVTMTFGLEVEATLEK